jgi:hypothetical protein
MVYVVSKSGVPLMPCENVVARLLLDSKKAKVKHKEPSIFTIKLTYDTPTYTQKMTHGVDEGSGVVGSAVVSQKMEVVYMSEITVRNDITEKMTRKAKNRRSRRNRKTRYRKARWSNRKNSIKKDRFSPTVTSKVNSHVKESKFVKSILPISHTILETGTFDPHALKNPEVLDNPLLYQQGINYGYENTKAFIRHRDGYKCQNKGCEKGDKRLHVHHIIWRSNNGGDEPENLVTVCVTCHNGIHDGEIDLQMKGKKKGNLSHATQMNAIRIQLTKRLPDAEETFGYITKANRENMGLPKTHYNDAVAIASRGNAVTFKVDSVLIKKCVADGDYQLRKGVRSEMMIPVGKVYGFRKFDKVRYKGKNYFIKGRMATGYAMLMDIYGAKVALKPTPKFTEMKRISARKTWLMDEKKIA